jgi:hypothetical protein
MRTEKWRKRYKAQEREWVRRILARLTPEQWERYEAECKEAPRHRNGKLYDRARAEIAERILLEDARKERTE